MTSEIDTAKRFSPWGLASSGTEHGEQAAFICYANRAVWAGLECADSPQAWVDSQARLGLLIAVGVPALPALRWLHAIPNGGERGKAAAGAMKAEGVKSGVADVFWPVAAGMVNDLHWSEYSRHGLYIELKRKNGKPRDLSQNQLDFRTFALAQGYAWCWAKGWIDAKTKLCAYMRGQWTSELEQL